MMKILFLVSSMQGGGAERVASLLCNYWSINGHEVVLVPTYSKRGGCHYHLNRSIKVEYLADKVEVAHLKIFSDVKRILYLRKLIKCTSPDVVVSFLTNVNVAAIIASMGLGIPVVVSERIFPPLLNVGRKYSLLRQLTYPFASAVVMQTSDGERWVNENIPKANAAVIANPVSKSVMEKSVTANPTGYVEREYILAVGRLEYQKGFDILIKSFAKLTLKNPTMYLYIIGEGSERKSLESLINKLCLCDKVFLPGFDKNVESWYQYANVFVLSSRYEGFPNVLLEAMSYGLPCVSFNCKTGPSSVILNEYNGILVDLFSGEAGLIEGISQVMNNLLLRQDLSKYAKITSISYSVDCVAKQWEDLFTSSFHN